MDEKIISEIRQKIQDNNSLVTYSWLEEKFDISPAECQNYLKKFVNENSDVTAVYLNATSDNDRNCKFVSYNTPTGDSIIVSLATKDLKKLSLEYFEYQSIQRNIFIHCEDVKMRIPSNTEELTVAENYTTKVEKSIKQEPVKMKIQTVKPKNMTSSSSMKTGLEKPKNQLINAFKAMIPRKESIEIKEENNEPSQAHPKISQDLIVKDSDKPNKSELLDENNNVVQTYKKLTASNLFLNFQDESVETTSLTKRKRRIIESDDEDEENRNTVLANESICEKIKPQPKSKKSPISRKKSKINEINDVVVKNSSIQQSGMKKVEKTFIDDEGFFVIDKVLVPINEGDNSASVPVKRASPVKPVKRPTKSSSNNTKDSKGKQTNILSFFKKN